LSKNKGDDHKGRAPTPFSNWLRHSLVSEGSPHKRTSNCDTVSIARVTAFPIRHSERLIGEIFNYC